jgi:hypothetical protein
VGLSGVRFGWLATLMPMASSACGSMRNKLTKCSNWPTATHTRMLWTNSGRKTLKRTFERSYLNALRLENKYIATVQTIPLVGITRKTMKDLWPILLSNPNIHHVSSTHKSDSIGRWDIITNKPNMLKVSTMINKPWSMAHNDRYRLQDPDQFPPPGIATRGSKDT